MNLLALLICIAVQKFIGFGTQWHKQHFCHHYLHWMREKFIKSEHISGYLVLAILILPIVIVTFLVSCFLYSFLFGLFGFLFSLAILFYTLGDGNFEEQLTDYFAACERDDLPAAKQHAAAFIDHVEVNDFPSLNRSVTCALLRKSLTQYFSIVFWFVLLGPVGAVLYYSVAVLMQLSRDSSGPFSRFSIQTMQVQGVLDWVPVRLLGLSYALVGHFGAGFSHGWTNILAGIDRCQEFIVSIGFASLEVDAEDSSKSNTQENYATLAMIHRALVVWVVIIALLLI